MSKSLGNFFTVRDVLQRYQPEVVRLFILSSHYRGPLNYTDENLDHAKASLDRLYTALYGLPVMDAPLEENWRMRFTQAMDDDFNTPEALAVLFDLAREINRLRANDETIATRLSATLKQLGAFLGLLQEDPEKYRKGLLPVRGSIQATGQGDSVAIVAVSTLLDSRIDELIAERTAARQAKNWVEADRIRRALQEVGIVLEDTPKGTIWRRE